MLGLMSAESDGIYVTKIACCMHGCVSNRNKCKMKEDSNDASPKHHNKQVLLFEAFIITSN